MKISTSLLDSAVDFKLHSKKETLESVLGHEISRGVEMGILILRDENFKEISLDHEVSHGDFIHICLK